MLATISQQRKLLMLTLRQNVQSTTVVVTVVAQDAASKVTEYVNIHFVYVEKTQICLFNGQQYTCVL